MFRVASLRDLRALWRRDPAAVLGGDHGGVPLTPAMGAAAADLLVDERPPAVLDLSPFREGEQPRSVADLAERRSRDARSPPLT